MQDRPKMPVLLISSYSFLLCLFRQPPCLAVFSQDDAPAFISGGLKQALDGFIDWLAA